MYDTREATEKFTEWLNSVKNCEKFFAMYNMNLINLQELIDCVKTQEYKNEKACWEKKRAELLNELNSLVDAAATARVWEYGLKKSDIPAAKHDINFEIQEVSDCDAIDMLNLLGFYRDKINIYNRYANK